MSTKANYKISEIGAGKVGFSKTRSIIEAPFYGNNVVKINTLREAYELAKNSPGTVVTDMPIKDADTFGLDKDAKVLLFNDGAVTGRYAAARRIKGEPGVDEAKLDKVVMDAVYETQNLWLRLIFLFQKEKRTFYITGCLTSSICQMSMLRCIRTLSQLVMAKSQTSISSLIHSGYHMRLQT